MDKQHAGAELNQLSRILFNKAATLWQISVGLELSAGATAVVVSLSQASTEASTIWAFIAAIVLIIAFACRMRYESVYDVAETMRRQSVLSEGLNWPIERAQFNEWKSRAGQNVLSKFALNPRSPDYYETQKEFGEKRLAEMTFESVFWTKNLYRKLRTILMFIFGAAVIISIVTISLTPLAVTNAKSQIYIVYAVYMIIPVLLSADFLKLGVRIERNIEALADIEKNLGNICQTEQPRIEDVMRLVSEYNSVLSTGVPIPNWIYARYRDELDRIWKQ